MQLLRNKAWALILLTYGCRTYEPRPLDREALDTAIATVDLDEVAQDWATRQAGILGDIEVRPGDGLEPLEVACLAVVLSPALRAARAQRGLAAAQVIQAGLLPNPQLSASLTRPIAGSTSGTVVGTGVGLSWDVSALVTQAAGVASARAADRAAALDLVWQEWQVANAARLAATQALWQQRVCALLAEEVASTSLTRESARAGLEARDITQPEMDVVDAMFHGFTAQLRAAERLRDVAFADVKRSMGVAPTQPVTFREGPAVAEPQVPSLDAAFEVARTIRPDLSALRAGYEAQEESVRAAVLSQFPKFSLNWGWARDTGNVEAMGPGLTIDLPVFDRGQGRIAGAEATRDRLYAEFIAREFGIRADLQVILVELGRLAPEILAQRQFVSASETLATNMVDHADHQLVGMIGVAQTKATAVTARLELLALEQRRSELYIGLDLVMGRLLQQVDP